MLLMQNTWPTRMKWQQLVTSGTYQETWQLRANTRHTRTHLSSNMANCELFVSSLPRFTMVKMPAPTWQSWKDSSAKSLPQMDCEEKARTT